MSNAGWRGEVGKTRVGKTRTGKTMLAIEGARSLGLNAIGAVAERQCPPSGGSPPGILLPTRRIIF